MVKHLPHISIEKYAAYLDGNLPDEEMQQMEAFIDTDADMQAVLEADSNVGADLDLDLLENEPIPCETELPSFELPMIDEKLSFEKNSFINEIFSPIGDSFLDEIRSFIEDDVNHEVVNEIEDMNYNWNIEDNPINLAISEEVESLLPDTTCDLGIHDGDYSFLELPPVINESNLVDTEETTTNSFEIENADNWSDSFDNYN